MCRRRHREAEPSEPQEETTATATDMWLLGLGLGAYLMVVWFTVASNRGVLRRRYTWAMVTGVQLR